MIQLKKYSIHIVMGFSVIIGSFFIVRGRTMSLGVPRNKDGYMQVQSINDVYNVYALSVDEIESRYKKFEELLKKEIGIITALSPEEQNKDTVLYALDRVFALCHYVSSSIGVPAYVHPDEEVRNAATAYDQKISKLEIDYIGGNKELYRVFKQYAENAAQKEQLSAEEQYLLEETLKDFKRSGFELPNDEFQQVVTLQKKLADLTTKFQVNINSDNVTLEVSKEELAGLEEEYISHLGKTDSGLYILRGDYPTREVVMKKCTVATTRRNFQKIMAEKAHEANKDLLKEIVSLRREYAQLLGFKSYADLALDSAMITSPQKALKLQEDLIPCVLKASEKDLKIYLSDIPEGIVLDEQGRVNSWDLAFIVDRYKKEHYDFDEAVLSEYFPTDETIKGLFAIYEQFFGLSFKEIENPQAWHEDVRLVEIKKKEGTLLGYVYLDLFPRDNKYSHAAEFSGVLGRKGDVYCPAVCALVCNFTPAQGDKPSLLKYSEVNTFFHEFGHALHVLIGATHFASHSGTLVKRDFVETPSQMLENWLEDKAILMQLAHHYKTGETVPEELVDKKLELLKLGNGLHEAYQIAAGLISLDIYDGNKEKDFEDIYKKVYGRMRPYEVLDESAFKSYGNFGHLMGYGPKYYGYLWSRILGADIFDHIKQEGLLNPDAGKRYSKSILEPGGSRNPADMVREYLGREPNQEAFLRVNNF